MNPATRDMLRALSERPGGWPRNHSRREIAPWVDAVAAWSQAGCPDVEKEDEGAPRAALHPTALIVLERLKARCGLGGEEWADANTAFGFASVDWQDAGSPIPGRLDADASDLAALLILLDTHNESSDPAQTKMAERAAIWVERARMALSAVAAVDMPMGSPADPERWLVLTNLRLHALIDVVRALVAEPAPLHVLDCFELLRRARRWLREAEMNGTEICSACDGCGYEYPFETFHGHDADCEYIEDRNEITAFLGSTS